MGRTVALKKSWRFNSGCDELLVSFFRGLFGAGHGYERSVFSQSSLRCLLDLMTDISGECDLGHCISVLSG